MRRLVILGSIAVMSGLMVASVLSQAAEPVKPQPTQLTTTPLAGDPTREVKIFSIVLPPGADTGRHFHHGDQYTTVQEGEINVAVDGKDAHVYKAGEALHFEPMQVHRVQNASDKPARTMDVFIIAKDKPLTEKSE